MPMRQKQLLLVIVGPLVGLLLAGCREEEAPPKSVVAVKTARAELTDVQLSVRAPATLFPREQASTAARITAAIRRLLVRKGDPVRAGQVLAELENSDLAAQRREAQAAILEAQATTATDVERARGQLATTEAALNQAQKIYERRRTLFAEGAIPERDLLVSQTEFSQAKTAHEVARRALELLESPSGGGQPGIVQSRLAAARARLANIEAQLEFTEIRSPLAGSITEQYLYPGDMAKPDTPVFTVMDLSVVIARAQVPEAEASRVALRQSCSFHPADHVDQAFDGRVTLVNQAVDSARRTVEVWCDIPNPRRGLRGGTFGSLTIITGSAPHSVVVPQSALQLTEGSRTGWVMVVDRNVAHRREVEAGETLDGKVRILKGLAGGEQLVVEGAYALPDGAQVSAGPEKVGPEKVGDEKKATPK